MLLYYRNVKINSNIQSVGCNVFFQSLKCLFYSAFFFFFLQTNFSSSDTLFYLDTLFHQTFLTHFFLFVLLSLFHFGSWSHFSYVTYSGCICSCGSNQYDSDCKCSCGSNHCVKYLFYTTYLFPGIYICAREADWKNHPQLEQGSTNDLFQGPSNHVEGRKSFLVPAIGALELSPKGHLHRKREDEPTAN